MAPRAKFRKRLLLLPPAKDEANLPDAQASGLLETVPQKTPELSYVVSPQKASLSGMAVYTEETTENLDSDSPDDISDEDLTGPVEDVDKTEPVLPSFITKPIKGNGEPTSQSFAPRNNG